jgi:hypothetical protein
VVPFNGTLLAHDWELEVLALFYTLLYSCRMNREGEDQIWWFLLIKKSSRLNLSIIFWYGKRLVIFLGRVFGVPRHLLECHFYLDSGAREDPHY